MKYSAEYKNVKIRSLEESDIENIRIWRNDPQNTIFLRDIGLITPKMQKRWFEHEQCDDTCKTFAIEEIGELNRIVGSVSIYDIQGKAAEIGRMMIGDPQARGKKVGYYSLILAMHVGCQKLGIDQYRLEVHEDNIPAKKVYFRAGFEDVGKHRFIKGGYELDMKINMEQFYEKNDLVHDIAVICY